MEELGDSGNVELPRQDGTFACTSECGYRVFGNPATTASTMGSAVEYQWKPWSFPPFGGPSGLTQSYQPGTSATKPTTVPSLSTFKKTIPNVVLGATERGKVFIESTEQSIYVKVPEADITVGNILADVGRQLGLQGVELVLLDCKLLPIVDAFGQ